MADTNPSRQTFQDPESQERKRYGLHPLLKVVIGCGAAVLIIFIVIVGIAVFAGYQLQKDAGGVKAQEEATRTFERLAIEHPFTPPEDGVVTEDQARQFLTVTDEVWTEVEPLVDEMNELEERVEQEDEGLGIGSILSGVRSMGKLMRARIVLAEELERRGISLDDYVWTGNSLIQAYGALSEPDAHGVPEPNLELARAHSEALAGFASEEGMFDKSVILMVAQVTDPLQGLSESDLEGPAPE